MRWSLMFVCVCKGITESSVQRIGESGIVEPEALVAVSDLTTTSCAVASAAKRSTSS